MDGPEHRPVGPRLHRVLLSDPDEIEAEFASLGLETQQLSRPTRGTWTATAQLGRLGFRATSGSGRHWTRGSAPAGSVLMQFDMGSVGFRKLSGQTIGPDDINVVFGGVQFSHVVPEQHRAVLFSLPQAAITEAMAYRAPGAEKSIGMKSQLVLAGAVAYVARIRTLVGTAFASDGQLSGLYLPDFTSTDIGDALIGALLSPWNRLEVSRLQAPRYQRLPIVRRVEDFMRAHLSEPLSLPDLCKVAQASERTLEYAFRDVYGVGAKHYLKLLRLNRIRHELKTLPADAASVTRIAYHYGFWHMGHFASDYRRLFGETPRQTRSRGRSGYDIPAALGALPWEPATFPPMTPPAALGQVSKPGRRTPHVEGTE